MKLIKVGAAILNQTPLDWIGNQAHIVQAIRQACTDGVRVLCLPEMCLCGYGCEDAFLSPGMRRMARRVLLEILPETHGLAVSLGLPVLHRNRLYNAVCLVADGRIVGFTAKQNLAREGLHYEPRWFNAWPAGARDTLVYEDGVYPFGDLIYNLGGVRLGFEICEDAWVARRPGGNLNDRGVDLILNPSASHFAFGKHEIRKRFVLEGSRAFGVTYVYSNLLGNEAGRAIYDGGALIASGGTMVAEGPRFSFKDFRLANAIIDLDKTRMQQSRSGNSNASLSNETGCIECPFEWLEPVDEAARCESGAWERGDHVKEEEFTRAVALGLFDYLRKSRSRGFVVSLSGGTDSAAVACLVELMVQLGCCELGREDFSQKIGLDQGGSGSELVKELLTCVYQATANSSETTHSAAEELAGALGARFITFDVEGIVRAYTALVENAIERKLNWEDDDIALQNIQARVRAPGVWMLANLKNALLLATSNRSEAAVGYATMDGDTCGGLSPIAGIDKAFLREWLRWLETEGPVGLRAIPTLNMVNRQQPTAELRPLTAGQTDESDLMPYDLLDAVERAAIRDKMTPPEVLKAMQSSFKHYGRDQLALWVERFFGLWSRNQWKRERYAPSFHLDDENLDPKTWCRFPILSGGFERELNEMKKNIQS